MSEFEKEQNVQEQDVLEHHVDCEGKPDIRYLDIRNVSSRAFHLIKKRYGVPQCDVEGAGSVYYLQSKTRTFDSVLRRSPCEIFKGTDDFRVPLGTSCLESVVSLYGLSNGVIYGREQWQNLMQAYNEKPCGETLKPLLVFLRAAAIAKCIEVSGGRKAQPNDELEYCLETLKIDERVILSFFVDMIR